MSRETDHSFFARRLRPALAQRHADGSPVRFTHTPSSHCNVLVHVFCGTTLPVSVTHAPFASTPLSHADASLDRATHSPLSH